MLGGALHLDQRAVLGADNVHVDVGLAVLDVGKIEHDLAVDHADGHGRDRRPEAARIGELALGDQLVDREGERDPRAGDRRHARAAIGLQHVTVDRDRALADAGEVHGGAQRADDQALDLLAAPAGIALAPGVGGAGQHGVFGRQPALALALALALAGHPPRDGVLDAGRAQHPGVPELDQGRALRVLLKVRDVLEGAELVGPAAVEAHDGAQATAITCEAQREVW